MKGRAIRKYRISPPVAAGRVGWEGLWIVGERAFLHPFADQPPLEGTRTNAAFHLRWARALGREIVRLEEQQLQPRPEGGTHRD